MTLFILIGYLVLVLSIGLWSHRRAQSTGEDWFIASRTIGSFVLLMTLFGTHMTSFALLGSSGESYRVGIGVFTLMASSSALIAPLVFFFLGTRVWAIGKRHGLLTQVQFVRARWQSETLGLLLFFVLVILLVPYLLIGVMGAGITLNQITDGVVPLWVGSFVVSGVVLSYVSAGGLRGTAWVNTFQTSLFMVLGGVTAIVIIGKLGGLEPAMLRLSELRPDLLVRGASMEPVRVLSYTFIPLSVGMFPHIFTHWLSAEKAATFRTPVILYPLCIAAVWLPMVTLGVLGHLDFPDLVGPAANELLIRQIALHAPGVLAGLLGAGVFAAIMSSLDSQSLSLATMFTQDVVRHTVVRRGGVMSERAQILSGRLFVVAVVGVTFVISLIAKPSIFGLGVWSFSGYAALLPILIAALYWRRSTAAGAMAAVFTVIGSWIYFFLEARSEPGYSVLGTGVMPVVVMFAASAGALIAVSLLTQPPPREVVDGFMKLHGSPQR